MSNKPKLLSVIFIFCLMCVIIYLIYTSPTISYYRIVQNYQSNFIKSDNPNKYILLWNNFFESNDWGIGDETVDEKFFEKHKCPITSCVITRNRSLLKQVYLYDAIVFHTAEVWLISDSLPKLRSPHQHYVFAILESPANTKHDLRFDQEFFNWTMSYRLDSDILWSYNNIQDIETGAFVAPSKHPYWRTIEEDIYDPELLNIINKKTKLVAWFVSNCVAISNRDKLASDLGQYIDVDIYGKCGTLNCPRNSNNCKDKLDKEYKFYLSFENSLCRDYVTEKLYDNMQRFIIPIVFGGANYSKFAPPYSYINANDFQTTQDLAEYLHYLDKNPEEYMKYFWWKKYYRVAHQSMFCELCAKLHEPGINEKYNVYKDIREWWFGHMCVFKSNINFIN